MKNADIGGEPPRSHDIDLSRVAPLRRAEVRRRISVIRRYLDIVKPSEADRAAAANALGIGVQQFMNLVRAWAAHGEAVAIAKAGRNAGASRSPRRRGLPLATRTAAEGALRDLPRSASHKEAIAAVRAACQRHRTRPPSDSMVSYLRLELRRKSPPADGAAGLLIGRAIASLPVLTGTEMALPEVALAIDLSDGTVVAAAIVKSDGAPLRHFALSVAEAAAGKSGAVTVGADDQALAATLPGSQTVSRFAAGRQLAKAIGRGIGAVRLTYGPLASTDPRRQLRAQADAPLSMADAEAAITTAVTIHNSARATARKVNRPKGGD